MRFSASRLAMWQQCQMKARFHYIDNLPSGPQNAKASFGTCIHHAFKLYNDTGNVELAVETFKDVWEFPEKLGVAPEAWPKRTTYGGLRDRGIEAINRYARGIKWESRRIIGSEHEFVVPFGKHELHGFVDCLESRRSGTGKRLLRVTDYKTNAKKPSVAELALNIQFTIYDWASRQPEFWTMEDGEKLFKEFQEFPRRNIWYHVMDACEIDAGSRDQEDFDRLYRLCESIERAYEAEVFFPNIGDPCELCPYTGPCGVHVPTKEELRSQDEAWI